MTSLNFLGDLPPLLGLVLAIALGAIAWWIYRREVYDLPNPYSWLLPTLRASAIALAILMLIGPTLHHRSVEGELGRLTILVDGSGSMAITDAAIDAQNPLSRFDRATQLLISGERPMLETLAATNEVSVVRFSDQSSVLWQSTATKASVLPEDNQAWIPESWGGPTRLGSAMSQPLLRGVSIAGTPSIPSENQGEAKSANNQANTDPASSEGSKNAAIVLLSDGQSNDGPPPLELAQRLAASKTPIFVVGYGANDEPRDLAVLSLEHPRQIQRKDTLRGKMWIKDRLRSGAKVRAWIEHDGKVVWEEKFDSQNVDRRAVDFAIPLDALVASSSNLQAAGIQSGSNLQNAFALDFVGKLETNETEVDQKNNARDSSTMVLARKNRVLLLDGRSRWETRYLRNAIERDPSWSLDAFLLEPNAAPLPYSSTGTARPFPSSIDDWFEYDLVIVGELNPSCWNESRGEWLKQLVENAGAGLILIDGDRKYLQQAGVESIQSLIPVKWSSSQQSEAQGSSSSTNGIQWKASLTPPGRSMDALQLDRRGIPENEQAWIELPALMRCNPGEALPGAEIIAELRSGDAVAPFLVTRLSGAGRVLYCASDETWRWRYQVADEIHQKYWNQLCRWVMRTPFAIQGEFVSLDTGLSEYKPGDAVEIRARLRDTEGKTVRPELVQAKIESIEGSKNPFSITLPLSAQASPDAVFRGSIDQLPVGEYRVTLEAAGFQPDALKVESKFLVRAPSDPESFQLARNEALLRQIAETSGGAYLPESEASKLLDLLAPISHGKIVESDILLWQSYYWFVPVIVLLATEWWLRKRAGLI